MKVKERKRARQLRFQGWPIRKIAKFVKCSKSSVSNWVRDIPLTPEQIERLKSNQDKGRAKAAAHPNSSKQVWQRIRNDIIESAAKEIPSDCSLKTLKIIGSVLYWAEGYKKGRNMVNFSNSDSIMIRLMMRFFREVCKVPNSKFRGCVHIHPHLEGKRAMLFWSRQTGIPLNQFHKLQTPVSRASKNKRDTLPLGTFRIIISDTRLQSKIKGWIKGIGKWAISSVG